MDMWLTAASAPRETDEARLERAMMELGAEELEKLAGTNTSPRLDRLAEQVKLAQTMGRELAHKQGEELIKSAGFLNTALNTIKPMAGKALGWAAKNPTAALGIGGAAVGAATTAPGHRLTGALTGGAIGAGAGHLGATGGVQNLANKGLSRLGVGMPKIALAMPGGGALAAGGALLGGVAGALHKSDAERAGLSSGHHVRNALMGAAAGAGLGVGAKKAVGLAGAKTLSAEAGALHNAATHVPTGNTVHNFGTPSSAAAKIRQMPTTPSSAAPAMSPEDIAKHRAFLESSANGDHKRLAWLAKNNPHLYPEMAGPATSAGMPSPAAVAPSRGPAQGSPAANPAATVARRRPGASKPEVTGFENTMAAKLASARGVELLKLAWSITQAEPGTPGGAQESEKTAGPPPIPAAAQAAAKVLKRPPPIPHPATSALKSLTPQGMHALQSVPLR